MAKYLTEEACISSTHFCFQTAEFKHLVFSLCLFHGILLEKLKYGPLGSNIKYEFTDEDLLVSAN